MNVMSRMELSSRTQDANPLRDTALTNLKTDLQSIPEKTLFRGKPVDSPPRRKQRSISPHNRVESSPTSKYDDASPRRRIDSQPSADLDSSPPRRRQKPTHFDENTNISTSGDIDASPPRRQSTANRAGSPRRAEASRESSRNESGNDDNSPPRRKTELLEGPKMMSGHNAGLQSANAFGSKESEIKRERDLALSSVDPALSGAHAATVYRDRRGKKLDMLSEFMRQQAVREGKVGGTRVSLCLLR